MLDATGSMNSFKNQLQTVPKKVVDDIKKSFKNYRFGYGVYRDKKKKPFGWSNDVEFIHEQSMTDQTQNLVNKIQNTKVSGGFDGPESGLDGLLQVLVCQGKIGWRPESSRIIVLITDNIFHVSGEGKMVGMWKEPDLQKCG